MPVSPAGAAAGKISRVFGRVRGRGHQHLLDSDEETPQVQTTPPAGILTGTPHAIPVVAPVGLATPVEQALSASHSAVGIEPQMFARSPGGSANIGKLSRAFDRVRGKDRQQFLASDVEAAEGSSATYTCAGRPAAAPMPASRSAAAPTGHPTLGDSIGHFDAASGPSLAAVTGFGLGCTLSAPARSSPGSAAGGKMSRAFDRMRGRRSQQLLEQDAVGAVATPAPRDPAASWTTQPWTQGGCVGSASSLSAADSANATLPQRYGALEAQPRLLGAPRRSVCDAVSKFGGRPSEDKNRML